MRRTLLAMAMAASIGGCGQASEEAFDKEFDTNFRASCVSAAVSRGAPEAIATAMCDCSLAGINDKFSRTEKMTLTAEQAQPITAECMKKAGQ
jgi:hypothetical protein